MEEIRLSYSQIEIINLFVWFKQIYKNKNKRMNNFILNKSVYSVYNFIIILILLYYFNIIVFFLRKLTHYPNMNNMAINASNQQVYIFFERCLKLLLYIVLLSCATFVKRYIALADLAQVDCFSEFNYLIASVAIITNTGTFRILCRIRSQKKAEVSEGGRWHTCIRHEGAEWQTRWRALISDRERD